MGKKWFRNHFGRVILITSLSVMLLIQKVFAKEETKWNYFASISVLKAKIYSDLLSGCADVWYLMQGDFIIILQENPCNQIYCSKVMLWRTWLTFGRCYIYFAMFDFWFNFHVVITLGFETSQIFGNKKYRHKNFRQFSRLSCVRFDAGILRVSPAKLTKYEQHNH